MELEKFFSEIGPKIKKAVIADYPGIRKKIGKEKPYALAFVSDDEYITFWLGINTYEHLEKTDAKYGKDGHEYTTKWNPAEWGYMIADAQLAKISDILSEKMDEIFDQLESEAGDLSFEEYGALVESTGYPDLFIKTLTAVFQELIQADVFGLEPDAATYFITMSDDERSVEIENNSAKILNSKKVYEEFLRRKTNY